MVEADMAATAVAEMGTVAVPMVAVAPLAVDMVDAVTSAAGADLAAVGEALTVEAVSTAVAAVASMAVVVDFTAAVAAGSTVAADTVEAIAKI